MSGLADLSGGGAGFGSAATIGGTALGTAFGSAMFLNMLGASAAVAGPAGLALGGAIGIGMYGAYAAGEAPNWVRYADGSASQDWRKAARASELKDADKPGWWRGINAAGASIGGRMKSVLGLDPLTGLGVDAAVQNQLAAEQTAWAPGNLAYNADALRKQLEPTYKERVNIDSMLALESNLFGITGRTAEEVYGGNAPNFMKLLDYYANYLEAGASPESLYSSQLQAIGAAGVPLGPQAETWMLNFAKSVPANERAQYEQAYKMLSQIPSDLGRPTTAIEAAQTASLAQKYGSIERAASEVLGRTGVGWFTSAFGVKSGSSAAAMMGSMFGANDLPTQNAAQRLAGMTAPSFARGGVPATAAAAMINSFAQTSSSDNVLGLSNLVIQAESVSLQTGQNMASLVNDAWGRGYDGRNIAEQRWYLSCLLYTSPSPRDRTRSRMPSSA